MSAGVPILYVSMGVLKLKHYARNNAVCMGVLKTQRATLSMRGLKTQCQGAALFEQKYEEKKTKGQQQSCSTAGVEILHANKSCSVHLLKSDTPSAEVLNNLNSYTPTAKLFPSNDTDFKSYTP